MRVIIGVCVLRFAFLLFLFRHVFHMMEDGNTNSDEEKLFYGKVREYTVSIF